MPTFLPMKKLFKRILENISLRRHYFCSAEEDIAEKNLNLLKTLSLAAAGILVFFFLFTPLIIKGWQITLQHILFLPAVLILYAIAAFYQKRKSRNCRTVTILCIIFECVLFVFVILIDVFPVANAPGSFMPLLCIALSVSFILQFRLIYSLIFFFEAIYIVCALLVKDPFIAQYDIFTSVVSIIFALSLAHIIMRLRIKDYDLNIKYKSLSMQDSLCGVLNKQACQEAVQNYLNAHNPNVECGMLFLDVDNFNGVNDQLGHYAGDLLLKSIGDVLIGLFRSTDIIGRFGGDEFMVLIKSPSTFQMLEGKCKLIQTQLEEKERNGSLPAITCSIGAVSVQRERVDFETLFKKADEALYSAKEAGKGQYLLCTLHGEDAKA